MSFTQLNPQAPLITPKGRGYAIGVIDYSPDHGLIWVVIITETSQIWCIKSSDVLGVENITLNRKAVK